MSYSTGTADSRATLIDLFKDFAVTSGWAVNRFTSGVEVSLQKTGSYGDVLYASLVQSNPAVYLSMADGYDAGKLWYNQPGAPVNSTNGGINYYTKINPFNAIAKYWFFSGSNPEFIAMVLLLPNNEFRHLVFGEISKTDLTVGKGAFMYGTNGMNENYPNILPFGTHSLSYDQTVRGSAWLRLNADERNGWWTPCRKTDGATSLPTEGGVIGADFREGLLKYNSLNLFSNSAALTPHNLYMRKQTGVYALVGHIPMWRMARRSAFIVDQVYTLGADDWMAFPVSAMGDTYSLVYRKVV